MKARRWPIYLAAALLLLSCLAAVLLTSDAGRQAYAEVRNRTPQSLIRYAQRRLEGHDNLQAWLQPGLRALQRRVERTPPPGPLPALGKGQQKLPLAPVPTQADAVIRADSSAAIVQALLKSGPGTHIVIAPGHYRFDQTLRLGQDGRAQAPIVVGAMTPGTVRLDFSHEEGVLVDRPHWIFENLDIRGTCPVQQACEHAFHVVGAAAFTTLRNNHVQDFNAHIKVNGLGGQWPDHGVVAFNTLTNTRARDTDRPVVMLDLVGAHHWKVQDNLVANFAKTAGNRVAYGLFMKGASEGGRIERNLVICSPSGISAPGERVGISFGGGGGNVESICRQDACRGFQHRHGWAMNNIVAHCNDAGIDVNFSYDIALAHNTLINTGGFLARGAQTSAQLFGNLYEGNTTVRDGAKVLSESNVQSSMSRHFVQPDALLLQWFDPPTPIPASRLVTRDFNEALRSSMTLPGSIEAPGTRQSQLAMEKK